MLTSSIINLLLKTGGPRLRVKSLKTGGPTLRVKDWAKALFVVQGPQSVSSSEILLATRAPFTV